MNPRPLGEQSRKPRVAPVLRGVICVGLGKSLISLALASNAVQLENGRQNEAETTRNPLFAGESIGDPSRTEISNDIKYLGWQTNLNAFIEPKATFGLLANREARHAATIPLGSPGAAKRIRGKFGIEAKGRLQ
jgi:hypothetical protein